MCPASERSAQQRPIASESRKRQLSPARQALLEVLQEIHYGEILNLQVVDGEPILDPSPEIFKDRVLGKDNGPHPARGRADFSLKNEVLGLFEMFDREQNIAVYRVVVQAGLPLRVRVKVNASF